MTASVTRGNKSERRQFARSVLPMMVTIDGEEYKGHDLSLGGMCVIDVAVPFTEDAMAKVAIHRRDLRVEFVAEITPINFDPEEGVQSFKFVTLTKMQASMISMLMHPEDFDAPSVGPAPM